MSQTAPATDLHAPGSNGVPAPSPPPPLPLEADGFPPFSEGLLAQFKEEDWLDAEYNAGRLMPYYGEYVVSANRTILAHDRRMKFAQEQAEAKAAEMGIPLDHLCVYNVPSVDDLLESVCPESD